tara:strand:- start:2847 stop:3119 length:273 start_codon:yes stop_codon:yes gene_type:complete
MKKALFFKNFVILNDFLEDYKATNSEKNKAKELKFNVFFELYDDDDEKYYSGYMHEDIEDEFEPQDFAESYAGCTSTKIRNKETRKMEIL